MFLNSRFLIQKCNRIAWGIPSAGVYLEKGKKNRGFKFTHTQLIYLVKIYFCKSKTPHPLTFPNPLAKAFQKPGTIQKQNILYITSSLRLLSGFLFLPSIKNPPLFQTGINSNIFHDAGESRPLSRLCMEILSSGTVTPFFVLNDHPAADH